MALVKATPSGVLLRKLWQLLFSNMFNPTFLRDEYSGLLQRVDKRRYLGAITKEREIESLSFFALSLHTRQSCCQYVAFDSRVSFRIF